MGRKKDKRRAELFKELIGLVNDCWPLILVDRTDDMVMDVIMSTRSGP